MADESIPSTSKKKSAWRAALCSLILPGLGQIYCGNYIRGLVFLLAIVIIAVEKGFPISAVGFCWICGVLDAILCAINPLPFTNKSAWRAALCSLILPGLGQLYCGRYRRGFYWLFGLFILAAEWGEWSLFPFLVVGFWICVVIDAILCALPSNARIATAIIGGYMAVGWVMSGEMRGGWSRTREIRANLRALRTAALAHHKLKNTYEVSTIDGLDFRPFDRRSKGVIEYRGALHYSYWYVVQGTPVSIPGSSQDTKPCDLTTPPTSVQVFTRTDGFVAAAKGIQRDKCDEWSIDEAGNISNTLNVFTRQ